MRLYAFGRFGLVFVVLGLVGTPYLNSMKHPDDFFVVIGAVLFMFFGVA